MTHNTHRIIRSIAMAIALLCTHAMAMASGNELSQHDEELLVMLFNKTNDGENNLEKVKKNTCVFDSVINVARQNEKPHLQGMALLYKGIMWGGYSNTYSKQCYRQAMQIFLQHHIMNRYFMVYQRYCMSIRDVIEQLRETKKMIAQAEESTETAIYSVSGYMILSKLYIEQLNDSKKAGDHLRKILDIIKEHPFEDEIEHSLYIVLTSLVKAHEGDYEKANKVLDILRSDTTFLEGTSNNDVIKTTELQVAYLCHRYSQVRALYSQVIQSNTWHAFDSVSVNHVNLMYYTATADYPAAERALKYLQQHKLEFNLGIYERRLYHEWGRTDMELQALDRYVAYTDSLRQLMDQEEVQSMDSKILDMTLKANSERARFRVVMTITVSILVIAIVMLVTVRITLKRKHRYNRELEAKNRQLDEAREEAEQASHVKSIFIRNMTHELHTPLNHIYGFAQLLADDSMPMDEEQTREMAAAIKSGTEQLTQVLDNIVEVADKLSGKTELSTLDSVLNTDADTPAQP